jgi:hypothetical protein
LKVVFTGFLVDQENETLVEMEEEECQASRGHKTPDVTARCAKQPEKKGSRDVQAV